MPPSKKHKFLHQSGRNKSKFAMIVFTCPDKTCGDCFKTEQGLAAHFGRSLTCTNAGLKLLDLITSIRNNQSKNIGETLLEPTDLSVAAYDSDDAVEVIQDSEGHDKAEDDNEEVTSIGMNYIGLLW